MGCGGGRPRITIRDDSPRAEADQSSSLLLAMLQHLFQSGLVSSRHLFSARRRIFAYLAFARARAAGSTSSGGSTTRVRTYCNRELVRANCACARVKSDCTCFPVFARVAAIRASSRSVASALSLSRSSRSQAATRNACSERKPRSLTAVTPRVGCLLPGTTGLSQYIQ